MCFKLALIVVVLPYNAVLWVTNLTAMNPFNAITGMTKVNQVLGLILNYC